MSLTFYNVMYLCAIEIDLQSFTNTLYYQISRVFFVDARLDSPCRM